jgi:bla regulator protein BlaR1
MSMLIEFVLRTSLIAVAVALVLYAMRIRTASVRHAVWSGVIFAMLLLPAFLAWGPRASLPILPRSPEQRTAVAISIPVVNMPAATEPTRSAPAQSPGTSPNWFAILYAVGVFTLLLRLAIGTLRTTRLTSASCAVPVTVGFFRPRIILPESSSDWPQARRNAVLIHEQTHARRRDPLFQWIALLNRALFWFHPLAWWLERQLSRLAEEACDAAVLAHGHDPHDYSETLLDLSRSVELAGRRVSALAMPMPGAFLSQRIRRMLSGAVAPKISRLRLALTIAACAAATAALSSGTLVQAQSKSAPNPKQRPSFEVASVKPCTGDEGVSEGGGGRGESGGGSPASSPGRLRTACMPVRFLIETAYVHFANARLDWNPDLRLVGGPDWINSASYQINAIAADNTSQSMMRGPMLQKLLEDRFQLSIHREARKVPVYELVAAKQGFKLTPTDGRSCTARDLAQFPRPPFDPSQKQACGTIKLLSGPHKVIFDLPGATVTEFSKYLPDAAGRPVVDKTGIKGLFDFHMEFARGSVQSSEPSADNDDAQSIFSALAQIGLRLQPAKGAKEFLVIDSVARASEN